MWLIEVNKCPDMSYSTAITRSLVPRYMEDITKVLVDKKDDPDATTGDLVKLLDIPAIREP